LCFIFFEDVCIIDEVIFVDEEEHSFFDDEFPLFVDKQGDHSLIFSDLNLNRIWIFAEFGTRIGTDFLKQFWNLVDPLVIPRDITDEAKYSCFENVAKKRIPQSLPFSSTLDEAWDIYDIEIGLLHGH